MINDELIKRLKRIRMLNILSMFFGIFSVVLGTFSIIKTHMYFMIVPIFVGAYCGWKATNTYIWAKKTQKELEETNK